MSKTEDQIRYKLKIDKETYIKEYKEHICYIFAVIDLSRPAYPLSWVVNLPKNRNSIDNGGFSKIFSDIDRQKFAIKLLNDALLEYTDEDIRAEIKSRIKHLTFKSLVKCRNVAQLLKLLSAALNQLLLSSL
jgi:hypothetical protein